MWRIRFLNPQSDEEFVRRVESLVADATGPGELQEKLRRFYPSAVVRERSLSGELVPAWYVYRDGRWVPPEREDSTGEPGSQGRPSDDRRDDEARR
jgi:hypothetical protein